MPLRHPITRARPLRSLLSPPLRSFASSRALHDDLPSQNHYETLKVGHDATPAEIKRSFYALSKTHHPDHNRNDPSAARKFHRIAEAYSVLGTPAKRAAYDREHGHHGHTHAHAHRKGSYHSSTGPAGGRPASGLSRRRGTYQGPPPSFYRSGGWGRHSGKRKAAHDESTGGGAAGAGETASTVGGMGPGQDPFGHTRDGDIPHFDRGGHERTHQWQDTRRAKRFMDQEIPTGPQESQVAMFFAVGGVLALAVAVPFTILGWFRGGKKETKRTA